MSKKEGVWDNLTLMAKFRELEDRVKKLEKR
jgi:hypothetical protein